MSFSEDFLAEVRAAIDGVSVDTVEKAASLLSAVRGKGGRLFVLGAGSSAGSASQAVGEFRRLCGFEAYSPADNISELTARANEGGWETAYSEWLKGSGIRREDGILALSVSGGDLELNISAALVRAVATAKRAGATVVGIVGGDGGFTARAADACVMIPAAANGLAEPVAEALHSVVCRLLAAHPELKTNPESGKNP